MEYKEIPAEEIMQAPIDERLQLLLSDAERHYREKGRMHDQPNLFGFGGEIASEAANGGVFTIQIGEEIYQRPDYAFFVAMALRGLKQQTGLEGYALAIPVSKNDSGSYVPSVQLHTRPTAFSLTVAVGTEMRMAMREIIYEGDRFVAFGKELLNKEESEHIAAAPKTATLH